MRYNRPKMPEIAEATAGLGKYCFRQLPRPPGAAVSPVSGIHMIGGVAKLGGVGVLENRKPKGAKTHEARKPGRRIKFVAPVCSRGLPSSSTDARRLCGRGWGMGNGKYGKTHQNRPNKQKQGHGSLNISPSASAEFQRICGRKTEDGKWGNLRKTDQISQNKRKGKDWRATIAVDG